MHDWNAVATVQTEGMAEARRLLGRLAKVEHTGYYHVLALKAEAPERLLSEFATMVERSPGVVNFVSHLMAAQEMFEFDSLEEFETKAREAVAARLSDLKGRSFHVRIHRRGMKGTLSSQQAERDLDAAIIAALQASGEPGRISFEDPDAIVQIETIDGRAGLSMWTRDELRRFPFLGVD